MRIFLPSCVQTRHTEISVAPAKPRGDTFTGHIRLTYGRGMRHFRMMDKEIST